MGCTDLEGLSAVMRDHAAHPRHHGPIKDFDGHTRMTGSCGDTMEFSLAAKNGKVEWVSFITDECRSSLACGSIATSLARGKRVEDAAAPEQKDIFEALGGFPPRVRPLRSPGSEYPHGGMHITQNVGVPFLGSIPIDPKIAEACDSGPWFRSSRRYDSHGGSHAAGYPTDFRTE